MRALAIPHYTTHFDFARDAFGRASPLPATFGFRGRPRGRLFSANFRSARRICKSRPNFVAGKVPSLTRSCTLVTLRPSAAAAWVVVSMSDGLPFEVIMAATIIARSNPLSRKIRVKL